MAFKFRFRKSFTIIPGIRINFGKTGYTSTTIGGRGLTMNLGRKGNRMTLGLPGTGCSWSEYTPKGTGGGIPASDLAWPKSELDPTVRSYCFYFYGTVFLFLGSIIIYCTIHGKAL